MKKSLSSAPAGYVTRSLLKRPTAFPQFLKRPFIPVRTLFTSSRNTLRGPLARYSTVQKAGPGWINKFKAFLAPQTFMRGIRLRARFRDSLKELVNKELHKKINPKERAHLYKDMQNVLEILHSSFVSEATNTMFHLALRIGLIAGSLEVARRVYLILRDYYQKTNKFALLFNWSGTTDEMVHLFDASPNTATTGLNDILYSIENSEKKDQLFRYLLQRGTSNILVHLEHTVAQLSDDEKGAYAARLWPVLVAIAQVYHLEHDNYERVRILAQEVSPFKGHEDDKDEDDEYMNRFDKEVADIRQLIHVVDQKKVDTKKLYPIAPYRTSDQGLAAKVPAPFGALKKP